MKREMSKNVMWGVLLLGIVLSGILLSYRYMEAEKRVTVEFFNAPMADVLESFRAETGLSFLYCDEEIKHIPLFSGSFKNVSVKRALKKCLRQTRYTYSVEKNLVLIKPLH